jgi:pyruvate/2-oxoglutarate dehydrogenase complex dihydrolipoamide dehydrogenase (E3) component
VRPGEALQAAREAPGAREAVSGAIDAPAAFAWREVMVSGYDDAGQARWAAAEGITVRRGSGRLDGPGRVRVGDEVHTAGDTVIATGSEPVVPPVPGLRELEGVWTNREATGVNEVPRRLLVLSGGAVGLELDQALARMRASVAIVEGADHLAREPKALGDDYVLELADGTELRGDRLLVATGRRPRVAGLGLETVGSTASRVRVGRRRPRLDCFAHLDCLR